MDAPELTPRRKRFADYMLQHDCKPIVAYRATRDRGVDGPGDHGNARAMHMQCMDYIRHHRALIDSAVSAVAKLGQTPGADDDSITRALSVAASRLRNAFVTRAHLIAYWEQVLSFGADQVLDDVSGPNPTLSHLVESYEITETVDGEGNISRKRKLKIPSKKDATSILTVLKSIKPDGPSGEESYYKQIVDDIKAKSTCSRLS